MPSVLTMWFTIRWMRSNLELFQRMNFMKANKSLARQCSIVIYPDVNWRRIFVFFGQFLRAIKRIEDKILLDLKYLFFNSNFNSRQMAIMTVFFTLTKIVRSKRGLVKLGNLFISLITSSDFRIVWLHSNSTLRFGARSHLVSLIFRTPQLRI